MRSAQAKPSRIPRIIVGGSALRSTGTSSSFRIISSPASTARNVTALIAKQTPTPKAAIRTPAIAGPDHARGVEEARVQRDRVRQLVAPDHLEGERVPAGRVEDECRAGEDREQVDDPERLEPAEHEHGEERREDHRDGLRPDHELAVVDPVGDDAGDEAEDRERDEAAEGEERRPRAASASARPRATRARRSASRCR